MRVFAAHKAASLAIVLLLAIKARLSEMLQRFFANQAQVQGLCQNYGLGNVHPCGGDGGNYYRG
jgi:hypothetical protein